MKNVKELIKRRRGQMLVHSCIYYEFNSNVISDHLWQEWANELRDLQAENPDDCNIDFFDDAFNDWNGDSGAFLPLKDEWVWSMASRIMHQHSAINVLKCEGINVSIVN